MSSSKIIFLTVIVQLFKVGMLHSRAGHHAIFSRPQNVVISWISFFKIEQKKNSAIAQLCTVTTQQSWALSVFLNFFNNKK